MKFRINIFGHFGVLLLLAAVLLISATPAQAVKVSTSKNVTNSDSQGRTATDLTFTVQVPPSEKEDYWMISYTIGTTPNIGGTRTDTPHTNVKGEVWRVDIRYDNIIILPGVTIRIDAEAELNKWNFLQLVNVEWSYDEGVNREGAPDNGFEFPQNVEFNDEANTHNTQYIFRNLDASDDLYMNDLTFYRSSEWYEIDLQWDSAVVEGMEPIASDFVQGDIFHGDSMIVNLVDIPNMQNSYIYVVGEMEYIMPNSDPEISEFRDGHEEELHAVPALTEWGMIILVGLLIASALWIVMRRRKKVVA